jgi:predicted TIM-barrel enzyme
MASIGLNVARDGHIAVSVVRALGATWVRVVAMPDIDLTPYFRELRAAGVKILLVLARPGGPR